MIFTQKTILFCDKLAHFCGCRLIFGFAVCGSLSAKNYSDITGRMEDHEALLGGPLRRTTGIMFVIATVTL